MYSTQEGLKAHPALPLFIPQPVCSLLVLSEMLWLPQPSKNLSWHLLRGHRCLRPSVCSQDGGVQTGTDVCRPPRMIILGKLMVKREPHLTGVGIVKGGAALCVWEWLVFGNWK